MGHPMHHLSGGLNHPAMPIAVWRSSRSDGPLAREGQRNIAMKYSKHINIQKTSQSDQIPGSDQVMNNAGGFSFQVDDWTNLDRFLILGTEGGSYYASE